MGNYFVSGACGGMGRAVSRILVENGHSVWGTDVAAYETAGERLHIFRADVTKTAELEKVAETVKKEAGTLDGIINLAGVYDLNSLIEMSEEDFVRDFDVNLFGAFRVNKVFAPVLAEKGRVVIVTSELAPLPPLPFTGIYAITKAALDRYADALRMELQLTGKKVIVLRPGAVKTGMLPVSVKKLEDFCANTKTYKVSSERFKKVVERVESRNVPPEKIASVIKKALEAKRPKNVYAINRNPLLLLYGAMPRRLRLWAIRKILK